MKAEEFKKLLKETVREVFREELVQVLAEQVTNRINATTKVTKYEPYKPPVNREISRSSGNPIADILAEMKDQTVKDSNIRNTQDISQFISAPGLGMENQ